MNWLAETIELYPAPSEIRIKRVIEKEWIQNHGFNVYLTPTTTKRNYNWVETPHQKEVIANKVNQELILG